jgi:GDPmannose 4,6-dehydratase
MYLMLQQEHSGDYVIATGESYKLSEFIEIAFRLVDLDWQNYTVSDKDLCRPTDIAISRGNPKKALEQLGWEAKHKIADIVRLMMEAKQDEYLNLKPDC